MTSSSELNKAKFFERIIAESNGNFEEEEIGRDITGSSTELTLPPLHRDLYTPLLWVPELGNDSEMIDQANDEEFEIVLLEEEGLDKLDMDIEMDHESGLWNKVQRSQASGPGVEMPTTETGQRTRMYRSAEFIDDSD